MISVTSNYLKTKELAMVRKYARWIPEEGRRETWGETVDRYFDYMLSHLNKNYSYKPDAKIVEELRNAVFNRDVMPSMRSVMTAGAALDRDHVAGYNCSFVPVDNPRSFDETMYILMCGTGVGVWVPLPVNPSLYLSITY